MNRYILPCLIILALIVNACNTSNNNSADPATIIRYEEDLFNLDTKNLKQELLNLQERYPVFLGGDLNDPNNINQLSGYLNDPMIREFYDDTHAKFPTLETLEQDMGLLQKNYKKHFPEASEFTIFTYVSGLDFQHPVVFLDSMMLIALDMYLNPGYEHYDKLGIPRYISRRFTEKNIARDATEATIVNYVSAPSSDKLISEMIAEGKKLFAISQVSPNIPENTVINYTEEQYEWCENHERELWAFMLKNELLFSSDAKYKQEYLLEAPSTPEFGDEAPARLGQYLGWQIVKAYHKKNPNVTLQQILDYQDENHLMQEAGYKP